MHIYIAHKTDDGSIQTVKEHLYQTAVLCEKSGEEIGLKSLCYLSGLLHDIGKLSKDFTNYIQGTTTFQRGDIDHSFAGAKFLMELIESSTDKGEIGAAKLIARVIISHHGLHDWVTNKSENYFEKRIEVDSRYEEIKNNVYDIIDTEQIKKLLSQASEEYKSIAFKINDLCKKYHNDNIKTCRAFYMGMLERMIESILVDADRCNTAEFMNNDKEVEYDTKTLFAAMNAKMEDKCNQFRKKTDKISKQRMSISDRCYAFADNKVEACRLVVPTGGGKTLSSLRFAIKYALKNNKNKIIYIAPFMSILEQNSDVIKDFVDDDKLFIEHFSEVMSESNTIEALDEKELRCEKLDAPVITATFVQFLNDLFAGKLTAVRRFHRLINTVIIIDEVQSIPVSCVYMFNLAINFLTKICNCTVVMCTATQPCIDNVQYPVILDEQNSMTGDFEDDFKQFKRTEIIPAITIGGYDICATTQFCMGKITKYNNTLIIVNTKKVAKDLYESILTENKKLSIDEQAIVIHLSTNMCPEHRRDKIKQIKEYTKSGKKVICISTQLIEAGVDVSFECVIRSLSGLDNIAQAAGRCNRNGEREIAPVYVININAENLNKLPEIADRKEIGREMIDRGYKDLLSDETIKKYFEKFYREESNKLAFNIDDEILFDCLSLNKKYASGYKPDYINQAFATAGREFKAIDNNAKSIIVPYNDDAKKMINNLYGCSTMQPRLLLRKLQKYTVNTYQLTQLINCNVVDYIEKYSVYVLKESHYNDAYGIDEN